MFVSAPLRHMLPVTEFILLTALKDQKRRLSFRLGRLDALPMETRCPYHEAQPRHGSEFPDMDPRDLYLRIYRQTWSMDSQHRPRFDHDTHSGPCHKRIRFSHPSRV